MHFEGFCWGESMRIDILCLFPEMFASPLNQSIINRAREQGLVNIVIHDIRDYTHDKHHTVDDYPYGGGPSIKSNLEAFHFHALKPLKRGYSLKMANFTI
jgi:tRNA (guanine-N1)-methyltransferase